MRLPGISDAPGFSEIYVLKRKPTSAVVLRPQWASLAIGNIGSHEWKRNLFNCIER